MEIPDQKKQLRVVFCSFQRKSGSSIKASDLYREELGSRLSNLDRNLS